MAGGKHAQEMGCPICDKRAVRTYVGEEEDQYVCEGEHAFAMDWARSGPPTSPQWPVDGSTSGQKKKARKKGKQKAKKS